MSRLEADASAVQASDRTDELRKRPPIARLHLLAVMCGLVLLGACNFVLLKVLYTAYGDRRAFFVNQAINFLYIVYGGAILYPRMLLTDAVTEEMYRFPKRHFFIMGMLDSMGTFLTCLGTPYTPGSLTPLLNQLLIPFTMLSSVLYLRVRYRVKEAMGALLIVVGASLSVVPNVLSASSEDGPGQTRWYAVVLYALSNFPMAWSNCYKEGTFDGNTLDVWYLTQWVSIFQFFISFLYMPLLALPGFGSKDGMPLSAVPGALVDGYVCFMEEVPECAENHTMLLLFSYCGVNVAFVTLGLYLTKHGSALLNAMSFSMLLPFTTLLFFTPLLGAFQEPLTSSSMFTFVGLVVTLMGFAIYQFYSIAVGGADAAGQAKDELPAPLLMNCETCDIANEEGVPIGQPSFQERIVGIWSTHGEPVCADARSSK